jgi:DNA (cytosine-5)-methyltransferase 1
MTRLDNNDYPVDDGAKPDSAREITTGSVCSGVGGLDLGFHQAGATPLWMCEFDPWRRKMLEHRFPGVVVHPDLNELDPADLAPVTVFHGGTPCQDFSQAGGREGLAGAKSMLFHHYVRIRNAIDPLYSVWENVLGAFSTNGGRDFAAVLGALVGEHVEVPRGGWQRAGMAVAESGAWATWRVLDAQWFGVAQRRRRVIVVASTRTRPQPEILLEPEGVCWDPPARGGSRSTVALDARTGADSRGPEGGGNRTLPDYVGAAHRR